MVNVCRKVCLHDACSKLPSFGVESSKTAVYCEQHAEEGMVNVHNSCCSHDTCQKRLSYNADRSKTAA